MLSLYARRESPKLAQADTKAIALSSWQSHHKIERAHAQNVTKTPLCGMTSHTPFVRQPAHVALPVSRHITDPTTA